MPNFEQSYELGRKYRTDWVKEFQWLTKATGGIENGFYKVCKKDLQPRKKTSTEEICIINFGIHLG